MYEFNLVKLLSCLHVTLHRRYTKCGYVDKPASNPEGFGVC